MKIKLALTELKDVDVEFISLVKRGANQTPIRIMKSEEAQMSKVLGVVPKPDKQLPTSLTDLKKYDVLTDEVFSQEDVIAVDHGDFLFAVSGVKKAFEPYNTSLGYDDKFKSFMVYPSIMNAMDMGAMFVDDCLRDNLSKEETVQKVDSMLLAMHGFVVDSLKTLPESVFVVYSGVRKQEESTIEEPKELPKSAVEQPEVAKQDDAVVVPQLVVQPEVGVPEKDSPSQLLKDLEVSFQSSLASKIDDVMKVVLASIEANKTVLEGFKVELESVKGGITKAMDEVGSIKSSFVLGSPDTEKAAPEVVKKSHDMWGGTALDIFERHRGSTFK